MILKIINKQLFVIVDLFQGKYTKNSNLFILSIQTVNIWNVFVEIRRKELHINVHLREVDVLLLAWRWMVYHMA